MQQLRVFGLAVRRIVLGDDDVVAEVMGHGYKPSWVATSKSAGWRQRFIEQAARTEARIDKSSTLIIRGKYA
jgi:hypothetical protein